MSRSAALRIVADLGNSRLKWGRLDDRGRVAEVAALRVDDEGDWHDLWLRWGLGSGAPSTWAIASVNPPVAGTLATFLEKQGVNRTLWYRSVADLPLRHALERPETAGADRGLAVLGALADRPGGGPGLVVLCGTAVTVERLGVDGVWQGGAIAAGLGLTARALHLLTAQLPLAIPRGAPPAWGPSTLPALEAGVFWGVAGAVRELLTRQSDGLIPRPWVVWTGGDAATLASAVAWEGAEVVPDLVLRGLASVAFGASGG